MRGVLHFWCDMRSVNKNPKNLPGGEKLERVLKDRFILGKFFIIE